jgi:hypothetical protein
MLLGLRKEFVKRGIDTHVGWSYLDADQLAQFCDVFRPDAVLEIDRTRNNADGLPKDVFSIAWIQDWRSVGVDEVQFSATRFGGSDLYYFCTRPEAVGVDPSRLPHWAYLLQATDPDIYFPRETAKFKSDFSLMGYIPPKHRLSIIEQRLEADIFGLGPLSYHADLGTVRDLLEAMRKNGLSWNTYHVREAHRFINDYIYSRMERKRPLTNVMHSAFSRINLSLAPKGKCLVPGDLLYGIENELMRALGRQAIVEAALSVSRSMRIYGLGMWETWPEFAPYFRGPLRTETEVRKMYTTTRLNLHNAMSQMHSRALDCMASGSVILVNRIRDNTPDSPECLRAFFEPGVHYFEYDEADLADVAGEILDNRKRRKKVGEAAARAVRQGHSWGDRVDQILSDLAQH